jgi:hypothetical protein
MRGALLAAGLILSTLSGQDRERVVCPVTGGKVTLEYAPVALKGRTASKDLGPGVVWRMSAGDAARLVTDVALLTDRLVLLPGDYRLSARRSDEKYELLVFRGSSVFVEDAAFRTAPLELKTEKQAVEQLAWTLTVAKDRLTAKAHWGTQSLACTWVVLPTEQFRLKVGPATAVATLAQFPSRKDVEVLFDAQQPLPVGMLVFDEADVRLDLLLERETAEGGLIVENVTRRDCELRLAALHRLRERLVPADPDRRLPQVDADIAALDKQLAAAQKAVERAILSGEKTETPHSPGVHSRIVEDKDGPWIEIMTRSSSRRFPLTEKELRR